MNSINLYEARKFVQTPGHWEGVCGTLNRRDRIVIVKMKFLSITGPKDDIERMTKQYLSKYEIQLENALTELSKVKNLRPFIE